MSSYVWSRKRPIENLRAVLKLMAIDSCPNSDFKKMEGSADWHRPRKYNDRPGMIIRNLSSGLVYQT